MVWGLPGTPCWPPWRVPWRRQGHENITGVVFEPFQIVPERPGGLQTNSFLDPALPGGLQTIIFCRSSATFSRMAVKFPDLSPGRSRRAKFYQTPRFQDLKLHALILILEHCH